jgi:hypothetical protein
VIATGLAALWIAAATTPALADQVRQQEWWLGKLNVTQAWQGSKGHGVLVAVLSDGIDPEQADLAGSVTVGPDYTNSHETVPTYIGTQGTAIASLIAGHGHGTGNHSGIVGIAPRARILSVRVTLDPDDPALDSTATGAGLPDAIAAGIRYAVAQHAKVIDLPSDPGQPSPAALAAITGVPIGGTPPETAGITAAAGGSTIEQQAVAYALHQGVVLVAPAGDNGEGSDATNYPAAYPGVISVGAFGDTLVKAAYSSRLPYVDITAPGDGVMAATAASYTELHSTTAASAMVAGVAALIRSRFPHLTPAQVSHALTSSTLYRKADGRKAGSGYGTVNAQRALAAAATLAAPGADRAGAGAVARIAPAAPAAAPAQAPRSVAPHVLRAAIASAGLLIVLLLLIAGYAALVRRARNGGRAAAPARAAAATYAAPVAFAGARPTDADRMLEAFAVPAGGPPAASGPFGSLSGAQLTAGQHTAALQAAAQHAAAQQAAAQHAAAQQASGQHAGTQHSGTQHAGTQLTAAQIAAQPASSGPGTAGSVAGRHAAGGGDDSASQAAAAWVPLGPAGRGDGRRPRVSGTPPWEPAARPDSELPWVAGSGPGRASAAIGGLRTASAGLAGALGSSAGAGSAGAVGRADAAGPQVTAEPQAGVGDQVTAEHQAMPGSADHAATRPGQAPELAWPGTPSVAAQPPAPSPSGGAWEDFTDTNMRAIPAVGDITGQFPALDSGQADGGTAPGGTAPGGAITGGLAPGGPVLGGPVLGGPVLGGAMSGGPVLGGAVLGGAVSGGTAADGREAGSAGTGNAAADNAAAGSWAADGGAPWDTRASSAPWDTPAGGAPWDTPVGPPPLSGPPQDAQGAGLGRGNAAPWPAAFAPDHDGSAADAFPQPPAAGPPWWPAEDAARWQPEETEPEPARDQFAGQGGTGLSGTRTSATGPFGTGLPGTIQGGTDPGGMSRDGMSQGGADEANPGTGLRWLPAAASDQWQPGTGLPATGQPAAGQSGAGQADTGQHWQPAQQDTPWTADTSWQQAAPQLSGSYGEQPSDQFGQSTARGQYDQPTAAQFDQPSAQYDQQAGQYGQQAGQYGQQSSPQQQAQEPAVAQPPAPAEPPWEPSVSPGLSWRPGAAQTPWDPNGGRQAAGQQTAEQHTGSQQAGGQEEAGAQQVGAQQPGTNVDGPQASEPRPGQSAPGGQQPGGPPWGPATDQGWIQSDQEPSWVEPRWDRVPDGRWEPTAPGGDSASGDDQGWRSGARTDTFPAITDD